MPDSFIDIQTTSTLRDIEQRLATLPKGSIELALPRHFHKKFFKDSWLASLIINAAIKSGHLTIFDYSAEEVEKMTDRFARSMVGVLAAYMAERIENNKKKTISIDVHQIIEKIVYDKRGWFEQSEGGGKSFSFLSFDRQDIITQAETFEQLTEYFGTFEDRELKPAIGRLRNKATRLNSL